MKDICRTNFCRTIFLLFFAFFIIPVIVSANWPSSHITEEVEASFYPNGSLISEISTIGYVEVDTGNTQDVLQYIRIELSETENTNLVSTTCFRNVASSPNPGDRTRMFVNTSHSSADFSYSITNESILRIIYLSLNYSNSAGGWDLLPDSENTLNFNLIMNSSTDIEDMVFYLRVATNTLGSNDSIVLSNPTASKGYVTVVDSDSDGQYDTLIWGGDLWKWELVNITFEGRTRADVNFDYNDLSVDIGTGRETSISKNFTSIFTNLDFSDRFSRGSVRQGLEMLMKKLPIVRGYIRNLANFLNYSVHSWAIYRIGELDDPLLNSTNEITIAPGESFYTDWYESSGPGKEYYAIAFDWEVVWNESATTYSSSTKNTLDLPELYVMDIYPYGDIITITSNTLSGRTVSVQESFKHIGYESLESDNMTAVLVPASGLEISISSIRVFYSNESIGGEAYEITDYADISSTNGNVTINITNLTGIIGHPLGKNEDIIIIHDESGSSSEETRIYTFITYFTTFTLSGTPVTKIFEKEKEIPGVVPIVPPPAVGVGPPAIIVRFADLSKEKAEIRLIDNNTAEIYASVRVYDTGTKGIKYINGTIFIPENSEIIMSSISLRIYDDSKKQWQELERDADFIINDEGVKGIGDKEYRVFSITKKQGTFDFYNNDSIELLYRVRLHFGTHELITRFSGYDTYKNRYIFEDIFLPIRVYEKITLEELMITERDFEQLKAFVGKPVTWIKRIDVYNPTPSSREKTFEIEVYPDVLNAYLVVNNTETTVELKKNAKSYVIWTDSFRPQERKTYYARITTPPIVDVGEKLDVLEMKENITTFILNITLQNLAAENYTNISFELPLAVEKIRSINDENGPLNYTDSGTGGIYVEIPWMSGNSEKHIVVIYSERPPILVIKPDKKTYTSLDSLVNLTTIIIPRDVMESMNLEIEVISPKPRMKTVYINIISLGKLTPEKATKLYDDFRLAFYPPGDYIARARLKRNFWIVLSDDEVFNVIGVAPKFYIIDISWVLIAVVAFILFLVLRRYRGVPFKEDLRMLRRRIKRLRKSSQRSKQK